MTTVGDTGYLIKKYGGDRMVYVTHVYDANGHLHDFYVHGTIETAKRQAATDVVAGHFAVDGHFNLHLTHSDRREPRGIAAEIQQTIAATCQEPGGRAVRAVDSLYHVHFGEWRAQVHVMQVLP